VKGKGRVHAKPAKGAKGEEGVHAKTAKGAKRGLAHAKTAKTAKGMDWGQGNIEICFYN